MLLSSPLVFAQITYPYANQRFEATHKKLQKNFQQLLRGVTLRSAVRQLSQASDVMVWLDRRVDGEQLVDLKLTDANYQAALQKLCDEYGLAITWIGATPCICRPADAELIDQCYWHIATQAQGRLVAAASPAWSWDSVAEPRGLLLQLAKEHKLELRQIELLEHDLWAPQTISAGDVATHFTLLLAGFGLTLQVDAGNVWHLTPVSISSHQTVVFAYPTTMIETLAPDQLTDWKTKWAHATEFRQRDSLQWLKAPIAAHRDLFVSTLRLPIASSPASDTSLPNDDARASLAALRSLERNRFTIHLKGRLMDILPTLMTQLKLQWNPAELTVELGEKIIDVEAKNLNIDQLLAAIGEGADCLLTRSRWQVMIQPK